MIPYQRLLVLIMVVCSTSLWAQRKPKFDLSPTEADDRMLGLSIREMMEFNSAFNHVDARCIGPTIMGGRVVDVDVDPADANHFFVAYASGGCWETRNNGTSFTPLFDHEFVMTIGDIAVDWSNDPVVWIGTGEVNSSRSSYSGIGVFRGQADEQGHWHWQHVGLSDTQHIGRVLIDPNNTSTVYVASLGHLFSESDARGVFKTSDGGKTWQHVFLPPHGAGCVDLIMDPRNSSVLYATSWNRIRHPWSFQGNGIGSSVWESQDGGKNWTDIAAQNDGVASKFNNAPSASIGRIGLAMHHGDSARKLYCIIDNHSPQSGQQASHESGLKPTDFKAMSVPNFLNLEDSLLNQFMHKFDFEEKWTAVEVKQQVRDGKIPVVAFYDFCYNANDDLFEAAIIGPEVYSYDFETREWTRTHEGTLDDLVYTYGYYFGLIRVSPVNPDDLYIAGVPLLKSKDRGKTWSAIQPANVHVDHHALWINPKNPRHLINGSDGGLQISYDDGENFINCNNIPVGQFYAIGIDDSKPYQVFGGLQDNGVWYGSSASMVDRSWYASGHHPFRELIGGDGMQVQVDHRDNATVYSGYQFGNYQRCDLKTGEAIPLVVKHQLGERPLRWNWQTPILLSKFNQDILYIGSNKLHRSVDRGEHFETLSGDLTLGGTNGEIPFGTLTAIDESPLQFGWLVTGSDDGRIHLSTDNGYTWNEIGITLPKLWVSRIQCSSHAKQRMYVTLNGTRQDHFKPYVFVTEDAGKTWKSITANLPMEPINVIREDRLNPNVLYVGTDHGLYMSVNRGMSWQCFSNLPAVAVHDLIIEPDQDELVVGTHGRSIWIVPLSKVRESWTLPENEYRLLHVANVVWSPNWGKSWNQWIEVEKPQFNINAWLPALPRASAAMVLYSGEDELISLPIPEKQNGLIQVIYDGRVNSSWCEAKAWSVAEDGSVFLPPGDYEWRLVVNGKVCDRKSWSMMEE
ncbi:MAG: glycosyl hydrolase [Flavobacteriales bacterium]